MKLTKKKGFTIVELVIVIAVIAILAAVLVPTFSSLVEKANVSKAMQEAKNAWSMYVTESLLDETIDDVTEKTNACIKVGNYYFYVTGGQFDVDAKTAHNTATGAKCFKIEDGKLVAETHTA